MTDASVEAKRIRADLVEASDEQQRGGIAMHEVRENPRAAALALADMAKTIEEGDA